MRKLLYKLHAKHKKGFTLFELLVVVVILGVLTVISIPTYNKVTNRSRVSDGLNVLDILASAQNKYFIEHGVYSTSLQDLNVPIKNIDSENQDFNIVTANFNYSKEPHRSCIEAVSNKGLQYKLVKNYKTNARTVCVSGSCDKISNYVQAGTYAELCPENEQGCTLSEEACAKINKIFDEQKCRCVESVQPVQVSTDSCGGLPEGQISEFRDTFEDCSQVTCGHLFAKYKCVNGKLVRLSGKGNETCLNSWLYDKCDKEGLPVNLVVGVCNCQTNPSSTCNIGQKYNEKYEDDPACTQGLSNADRIRCRMKHSWELCIDGSSFKSEDECIDKATYCPNGYSLDKDCNCVNNNDNSCYIGSKKYLEGATQWFEESCSSSGGGSGNKGDNGKDGGGRGANNNSSSANIASLQIVCGVQQVEKKCSEGDWVDTGNTTECAQKTCPIGSNSVLNTDTCQCEKSCPFPKPSIEERCVSTSTVEYCDPCPDSPSLASVIAQITQQSPNPRGFDCLHCGYRNTTNKTVSCDTQTGSWYCDTSNNECNAVSGNFEPSQDCDGNGTPNNKCGYKQLDNVLCKMDDSLSAFEAIPSYGSCQYKPGNNCFTGQTQTCYIGGTPREQIIPGVSPGQGGNNGGGNNNSGEQGIMTCINCRWSECEKPSACASSPQLTGQGIGEACTVGSSSSLMQQCGTKVTTAQKCNETTGKWEWDFSVATCENLQVKPSSDGLGIQTHPTGCSKCQEYYKCEKHVGDQFADWHVACDNWEWTKPNYNCNSTTDYNGYYSYNPNSWCKNCRRAQCPSGSQFNSKSNECYRADSQVKVFQRVMPFGYTSLCHGISSIIPNISPQQEYLACKATSSGNYFTYGGSPGDCPKQPDKYQCINSKQILFVDSYNGSWADHCASDDYDKVLYIVPESSRPYQDSDRCNNGQGKCGIRLVDASPIACTKVSPTYL